MLTVSGTELQREPTGPLMVFKVRGTDNPLKKMLASLISGKLAELSNSDRNPLVEPTLCRGAEVRKYTTATLKITRASQYYYNEILSAA